MQRFFHAGQAQAVQVTPDLLHLFLDVGSIGLRPVARHLHQTADSELLVVKEGLSQAADALQTDQQQVVRRVVDMLDNRLGEQGQGVDAGKGNLVGVNQLDPGCYQLGIGNGGQQYAIILAALLLPAYDPGIVIRRVAEQTALLALQDRLPVRAKYVRDGVLAVFLLEEIREDVNGGFLALVQITLEVGPALFVTVKQVGTGQVTPLPVIDRRLVRAEIQHAPVGEFKL